MSAITGYNPATAATAFSSGTYRHVALSISGTVHTLYLDGSMVAQNLSGGNVFASYSSAISNVYIGCAGDLSYGLTGAIDDFKIWNRALPATDISAIYYANYVGLVLFTPNLVSGMTLWLDANDATTFTLSGTQVSTWTDKSGLGNNAVAVTNITSSTAFTTGPTSLISKSTFTMNSNSYPTIYFSPTTQNGAGLRIPNISVNTFPMTMFFVFNFPTTSSLCNYLLSRFPFAAIDTVNNDNGLLQILQNSSSMSVGLGIKGSGGNAYIATGATTTSSLFIMTVQYTASSYRLNLNGAPSSSGTPVYTQLPTGATTLLGDGICGPSGMYFCEKILYQGTNGGALTTYQIQQVEGYLAWKWGLQGSLPGTHPYSSAAPTVSTTFAPTQISGLNLWLDANIATTFTRDGSSKAIWTDKSGSGNNMAQTAANTGKLVSLVTRNSYPAVLIPQAVPPLRSSTLYTTTFPMTFFLVFSVDSTSGGTVDYNQYLSGNVINDTPAYNNQTGTIQIVMGPTAYQMSISCTGSGFGGNMSSYTVPTGSTFLMTIQINGSGNSPTNAIWNLNGTLSKSTTFSGTGNATSNQNGSILYSGFQASYINECVYYQSYLNSTLLQQVEGYLAWKWGLQTNLPTTHPYYIQAPTTYSVAGPIDSLSATTKAAMLGTGKSAGAYGTRVLYSGYTGPVMNIRNGTGNATLDFYADAAGNLGTGYLGKGTSLATWLNGGNAYVTTWYDQTGNGNHATQGTAGSQPIYNQTLKNVDFGSGTTTGQSANANAFFNLPDKTIPYGNTAYSVTLKHGALYNLTGAGQVFLGGGTATASYKNNFFGMYYNGGNPFYYNGWWGIAINAFNALSAGNVVSFIYQGDQNAINTSIYINTTNISGVPDLGPNNQSSRNSDYTPKDIGRSGYVQPLKAQI